MSIWHSLDDVILSLQDSAKKVFQLFPDNQIKGNTHKYHLLFSKNDETQLEVTLKDSDKKVFQLFPDNQIKGNTHKCHLLLTKNNK